MKFNAMQIRQMELLHKDQKMQQNLNNIKPHSAIQSMASMLEKDLRLNLCKEMATMGDCVRQLLSLLDDQSFVESLCKGNQVKYQQIIEGISDSAIKGQGLFMRSRALDQENFLVALPNPEIRVQ